MSKNLIGTEPGTGLALLADITLKYRSGAISTELLDLFAKGQLVPAPGVKLVATRDPLGMLFNKTERLLSKKLGRHIVPFVLPATVTVENMAKWAGFNMQPIFLPEFDLTESCRLPKKWIRPEARYYEWLTKGKIGEIYPGVTPTKIRAGWYLVDMSVGVDYTDGTQVFPNDPWAPLIEKLRCQELVGKYDKTPLGSRFAITHDEWIQVVLGFMASELGFPRASLSLERASDFNAIGNIYDPNRGRFNMWEWFADSFGDSSRLVGGPRCDGGLAGVRCRWHDVRRDGVAGRPLVSLG